ncbi:cob(I)yrinic acid a,c-diamide adenosyltransferase [Pararcticibacter amylolyticus]|uniref:Corrinoid adenosyltransferase n=1 Tax=Pararcticibacter amylolyticus TaxID=2173175 RepID=A0A2U2PK10_9SPHI|nr:cob(I)yrinic acid a,c-diamide adenosyltransferase [Pararcticibacter amylolyticus]PWG81731.1 cob(I)yrinic acid a,c-diamide adenosyltransferase [Pararcticibacter amylolyticus]
MKIYTKTGDKGFTSLIGGTKVPKYDLRIESYGTVDELNSYIGLVRDQEISDHHKEILMMIQEKLFVIGAILASDPDKSRMKLPEISMEDVSVLEKEIDAMDEVLPELRHFVLPGGSTMVSFCHIARCVCRKAERFTVHLAEESVVPGVILVFLNRLSDYLFVLARKLCFDSGISEVKWLP